MTREISRLLNPESVAIIGVSEDPSRIGGRLFKYIRKHGYKGHLALVNPKYQELNGVKCYPTISDVPGPIGCALIAVPEKHVFSVLSECADSQVGTAIIFSSGYAEMGSSGKQAQDRIKTLARTRNLRICGPNCIGVINFHSHTVLSFSQLLEINALVPGNIAFVSQSGALGGSLVNRAQDKNIGLSYFISSGNEADLDLADYIRYLVLHDEKTKVIAALIEGVRDGAKFVEVAELALKHRKPIIVLKIGETEAGKKAAASHTGSMTGSDAVIDALFNQKGIIRVRHYDELFQTAALFAQERFPGGNRVGILTSSGGAGVIMADYYTKLGLRVPEPSQKTRDLASKEIAAFGKVANPFDLTGQIFSDPEMFKRCMKLFVEDDNFDIIQVNVSMVAGQSSEYRATMLLEAIEGSTKPIVTWWAAGSLSDPGAKRLNGSKVTLFRSPDRCAAAVASLVKYHRHLAAPSTDKIPCKETDHSPSLKKAGAMLQAADSKLSEHQSKELLDLYGIPVTREMVAASATDAVCFAEEIGYPVVLKVDSPDILHKSEANAIRMGISSKEEIMQSYDELVENAMKYNPRARINGILVQETVRGGSEVMIGMSRDPQFGPAIVFGLGGIFVEILKDISLRVAPLSAADAEQMVKEIKSYPILTGVRGRKRSDIKAIVDVLIKISRLAKDWEDTIAEIDINPLIVMDEGRGVKAVDALVVLREPEASGRGFKPVCSFP
ncbi:MAG: acetate--CoA ligase family protein [Deltaproteobacteria bacterium]|nr:acetate--CoA ligase family protein [Deltaproteobacteria bacterium]